MHILLLFWRRRRRRMRSHLVPAIVIIRQKLKECSTQLLTSSSAIFRCNDGRKVVSKQSDQTKSQMQMAIPSFFHKALHRARVNEVRECK